MSGNVRKIERAIGANRGPLFQVLQCDQGQFGQSSKQHCRTLRTQRPQEGLLRRSFTVKSCLFLLNPINSYLFLCVFNIFSILINGRIMKDYPLDL